MARRWQVGWVVTQSIRPPAFANHAADVWARYLLYGGMTQGCARESTRRRPYGYLATRIKLCGQSRLH